MTSNDTLCAKVKAGEKPYGNHLLGKSPEARPLVLIDGLVLSLVLQEAGEAW